MSQWTDQNRSSKVALSYRRLGERDPSGMPALGRRGGQHLRGRLCLGTRVQPWPPTTLADPSGAYSDDWPLEQTGHQLVAGINR